MSVGEELRNLEAKLLTAAVRRDRSQIEALLAEEFCEFGSSGRVFSRASIVEEIAGESERRIEMKDFACEVLGAGAALVRYRSVRRGVGEPDVEALRSSVWVERGGRWQVLFHQGTPVRTRVGD
jgi:hypothetical protein